MNKRQTSVLKASSVISIMDTIYLVFSSFFLVLVVLTAADPDPWDDHGYHGDSYSNSGYGYSHVRSFKPKRKTGEY